MFQFIEYQLDLCYYPVAKTQIQDVQCENKYSNVFLSDNRNCWIGILQEFWRRIVDIRPISTRSMIVYGYFSVLFKPDVRHSLRTETRVFSNDTDPGHQLLKLLYVKIYRIIWLHFLVHSIIWSRSPHVNEPVQQNKTNSPDPCSVTIDHKLNDLSIWWWIGWNREEMVE